MVLRIFEMTVTSGFLTALECNKFIYPDPLAGFSGLLLRGRKGRKKGNGREREKEGKGKERKGPAPLLQIHGSAPVDMGCLSFLTHTFRPHFTKKCVN